MKRLAGVFAVVGVAAAALVSSCASLPREGALPAFGNPDEGVDATALSGPPGEGELLVFVAFYASDQKNRDLAVSGSIWDVRLTRGTTRVKPLKIERVRQSPAVVDVFPWVDRYDDLYLLRFAIVDAATSTAMMTTGEPPLVLEVDSAIARTSVRWTLTP